jgi:CDGSH-type Zn-finger protein
VLNAPRVFLANVEGPWLHPETASAEHLVHVAQSCPSGAITYQRLDGGVPEAAPEVNVINIRENGPYAFRASLNIDEQAPMYRATLCRCGKSKNKPFCDNTHREIEFEANGEPKTVPSEPLDVRGGELHVVPVKDGPLKVRGPLEICSGTGRTVSRTQYVKLCRCGGSANKPFCDDTHLRIKFRSGQ